MKRVLLTGYSGFTGYYVSKALIEAGHEVVCLSDDGTFLGKRIDLLNFDSIRMLIQNCRPSVVIHLAAVSSVTHENTSDFYRVNVLGTKNLLEACIDSSVQQFFLASSANVYGDQYTGLIKETFARNPKNDYAVSKSAAEDIANLYRNYFSVAVLRPFNYTGVGQSKNFLIPKIVNAFKKREDVLELGNIDVARDFSDVRFVARVYASMVARENINDTINVCSGKPIKLKEIVSLCSDLVSHKLRLLVNQKFVRKNDVMFQYGSTEKLASYVNMQEVMTVQETLSWMLNSNDNLIWPAQVGKKSL